MISRHLRFELPQNIRFTEQEHIGVVHGDLGASVLRQKDLVPFLERGRMQGTRDISLTGSDGHDLALVGILRGVGGEVDATGGLDLLGCALHEDAVSEWSEFAEEGA